MDSSSLEKSGNSDNTVKLISLNEASQKLAVTVEELLKWNEHNILKPVITTQGQIGYTQNQLSQFLAIKHTASQPAAISQTPIIQQIPTAQKINKPARSYSVPGLILSALVIFSAIIITALITPGLKTSSLKLPDNIAPPDPLTIPSYSAAHRDNINNIGEDIKKEKINSPVIFEASALKNTGIDYSINQKQKDIPGNDSDTNDYLSIAAGNIIADKNSAIDKNGIIDGEVKPDSLIAVVEEIDNTLKNESFSSSPANTASQLFILMITASIIMFAFRKYLFPDYYEYGRITQKIPSNHIAAYQNNQTPLASPYILKIDQKTDGSVVILFKDREYKISKPELNSESDQFIERLIALTRPDIKEIEYDITHPGEINLATPLSRIVTRLGFVGLKRELFFPRTSKSSVCFRRYLNQQDLNSMNLTAHDIINDLTKNPN